MSAPSHVLPDVRPAGRHCAVRRRTIRRAFAVSLLASAATLTAAEPVAASAPTVSRVTPARVTLYSGVASKVPVAMSGASLDEVASVSVIDARGSVVSSLSVVFTGLASATQRSVEVRGTSRVPIGTYRLRITTTAIGGRTAQVIDLPAALVQVEVGDGRAYSGHGYPVTALLTCAQCHDMLAANVPHQFSWDLKVVVAADTSAYSLPRSAYGATVEQIVHGKRSARSDGLMCTACHNPPTGGATVTLTESSPDRTQYCAYAAMFVAKQSKPLGLRNFFNNWKNRNCP